MYSNPVLRPEDEEERLRRERMNGGQHPPSYAAPINPQYTSAPPYLPANARPPYQQHYDPHPAAQPLPAMHATSPIASHTPSYQPQSPVNGRPYYDPAADHEKKSAWANPHYAPPAQPQYYEHNAYPNSQPHYPPAPAYLAQPVYPVPAEYQMNSHPEPMSPKKPQRADPMAFSNILSSSSAEAPGSVKVKSVELNGYAPKTGLQDAQQVESEPLKLKITDYRKDSHSDKENEVIMAAAQIDENELGELEAADYEFERAVYIQRRQKRALEVEALEVESNKRQRRIFVDKLAGRLGERADAGAQRFRAKFLDEAQRRVAFQEVQDEKERKKDMQRKRRREKTVQQEFQKRKDALEKASLVVDDQEREKLLRAAQKAEHKAKMTKAVLERGDQARDEQPILSPIATDLGGGGFSLPDEPRKKTRGGFRPRKSKEQKEAEKAAAAAAYELIDPIPLPKESKRERRGRDEYDGFVPFASKGYNQIYEQIWRDIARKDVPRVYRIKELSLTTKQSNLRKTAQLASKEARRWQLRTNKSMKDVQARGKRGMREMMSFWKKNEREERDMRKMAERAELDAAKRAEADREAARQSRKLNFLISQTELYSHFIGRKIKTDEVERSTDDPTIAAAAAPTDEKVQMPDASEAKGAAARAFDQLNFDEEDEETLRQTAMANAQSAVQAAQDKARAFNKADLSDANLDDDGEMNFQNPTSLGDVEIPQPKMLTCQLKEYQLKGLNWLVNLYEQGINGILADEMGLGKTVQSISVMSYLAEAHNIWGPFLVIAPASTLHNWQQEITRFVPDLKVLPYWGSARDRKVLRKFWDRKHITYTRDAPFHVLVTSYQLVVQDAQYFQKIRWQYMILDEAQAIKSSQSSRWKSLLGFHCRNRLLLTGTPIQNNMQELWALLHFIMPTLFDSHDEFSDWFSKDIESHAQSNTKLNEDQLKRLHMILKPFMLRRVKKHVQKELGDKIEKDVYCDLAYRQRSYYTGLRNRISLMDLIEKATVGDDTDTASLLNLVMQFRKVCNHPDLFERADTTSPYSMSQFGESGSFLRETAMIYVAYSTRNVIEYDVPKLIYRGDGRLALPSETNNVGSVQSRYLEELMNVWSPSNLRQCDENTGLFSWLRLSDVSPAEARTAFKDGLFERGVRLSRSKRRLAQFKILYDDEPYIPTSCMLNIVETNDRMPLAEITHEGYMRRLLNVSDTVYRDAGLDRMEQCATPAATAPPIELVCSSQGAMIENRRILFDDTVRNALFGSTEYEELQLIEKHADPSTFPVRNLLPPPVSQKARFTNIGVPSMRRFVTDSGKLSKLDQLLVKLKEEGHRVLLYFQMTRMIDLMEEYLTYRNYKYLRLDGSTKLEDRRDTVHDFQTRPDIFIFLLSTRAGGLGINLTAADTVIFYDSDWNPTIDSQAMDRAHRLGQTRQVTVYRMITRNTIEERIRKRALQKEEVQRVVISGGQGGGVDFNTRSRDTRNKDIAMWLADDDQAAEIERRDAELANDPGASAKKRGKKKGKDISLDEMYHEGEGHFDDQRKEGSGVATPDPAQPKPKAKRGPKGSKRAKTMKQRLRMADGGLDGDVDVE